MWNGELIVSHSINLYKYKHKINNYLIEEGKVEGRAKIAICLSQIVENCNDFVELFRL